MGRFPAQIYLRQFYVNGEEAASWSLWRLPGLDSKLMAMIRDDVDDQEVDLWWGSYAGRTMLPSFLVCLVLTGLIILLAWTFVERGQLKLTILGLGGLLWLVQLLRFAYRYFGFNYRLTSKRLFRSQSRQPLQIPLVDIAEVRVERSGFEQLVGVGRVFITFPDKTRRALVLAGVNKPNQVAEQIRTACQRAKGK
jgi:hypothetical protein